MEPRNARKKWYPEETKRLVKAYKKGATIEELMDTFGRSQSGIINKLYEEKVIKYTYKKSNTRVVRSKIIPPKKGLLERFKQLWS